MKDRLKAIFNLMLRIETKGDSTIYMTDCLRELADILNSIPDKEPETDGLDK